MGSQEDSSRDFALQPDGTYRVTGDMLIGDVIAGFPKAAVIMLSHGLHCVGCHANVFDTIEDGARGHGIDDVEIAQIIDEINAAINKVIETLELSPRAIAKIKELRALEAGKEDWPLRISVVSGGDGTPFEYEMDFSKTAADDHLLCFDGLEVVVSPKSYSLLQGSSIDYLETLDAAGFKIDNPRQ